ncbi:hypothetical protein RRG08_015040 [Elysia crispata]|uniref:Secreted protein n=1 Tax=Elysia crispata TaxID=231223 RepID=A0AAE1B5V3_9GAST|nr:hypothetical protein RRG08_015040 [Elysia crispata]
MITRPASKALIVSWKIIVQALAASHYLGSCNALLASSGPSLSGFTLRAALLNPTHTEPRMKYRGFPSQPALTQCVSA